MDLVRRMADIELIPYISKFAINDKIGSYSVVTFEARGCIAGGKKAALNDFNTTSQYAPVVRHATIRTFIEMLSDHNLLVEAANTSNT